MRLLPKRGDGRDAPWKRMLLAALVFLGLVVQGQGLLSGRAWCSDIPADLRNRIFLSMRAEKESAYPHERIGLTVTLYMESLSVQDVAYPRMASDGFSLGDFGNPIQQTEVVGGKTYDTLVFMTTITPAKAGRLTVKPASLRCHVMLPSTGGPAAAFFGQSEINALDLQSEAVDLDILPFPKEGRPPSFHGVVGKFSLTVDVHPQEVRTGDPVKVTATIRGAGNLRDVRCPPMGPASDKDRPFRIYEPRRLLKEDAVICEHVLIPLSTVASPLPPVSFSYFDAETASYTTLRQGPFPLKMANPAGVEIEADEKAQGVPDPYRYRPRFFVLLLFLLALLAGVTVGVYRKKSRILSVIKACIRRLQSARKRNKTLRHAKRLLEAGHCTAFYTVIFKSLQEFLGETFPRLYGEGMAEAMAGPPTPPEVGEAHREKIEAIFRRCDMARYAAVVFSKEEMRETFIMTKDVLKNGKRFI